MNKAMTTKPIKPAFKLSATDFCPKLAPMVCWLTSSIGTGKAPALSLCDNSLASVILNLPEITALPPEIFSLTVG